mgnify:FL=1
MKTIENLIEIADTHDVKYAIDVAKTFYSDIIFPSEEPRPKKKKDATEREIFQYLTELKKWEISNEDRKAKIEEYNKVGLEVNTIIEGFIREYSGLNDIPEQYRDKVYTAAYVLTHSGYYIEIYEKLLILIEIFR